MNKLKPSLSPQYDIKQPNCRKLFCTFNDLSRHVLTIEPGLSRDRCHLRNNSNWTHLVSNKTWSPSRNCGCSTYKWRWGARTRAPHGTEGPSGAWPAWAGRGNPSARSPLSRGSSAETAEATRPPLDLGHRPELCLPVSLPVDVATEAFLVFVFVFSFFFPPLKSRSHTLGFYTPRAGKPLLGNTGGLKMEVLRFCRPVEALDLLFMVAFGRVPSKWVLDGCEEQPIIKFQPRDGIPGS